MMLKALHILFLIVLGVIQVSFLSTWPAPVNSVNLLLALVIFITVLLSYEQALAWGFGAALFLELFSVLPFGVTTVSMLATIVAMNALFKNFFTNRSFYSLLLLGYFGTAFFSASTLLIHALVVLLLPSLDEFQPLDLMSSFVWQPLLNLVVLGVIFLSYYFSTSKLRSIFFLTHDSYEAFRK